MLIWRIFPVVSIPPDIPCEEEIARMAGYSSRDRKVLLYDILNET